MVDFSLLTFSSAYISDGFKQKKILFFLSVFLTKKYTDLQHCQHFLHFLRGGSGGYIAHPWYAINLGWYLSSCLIQKSTLDSIITLPYKLMLMQNCDSRNAFDHQLANIAMKQGNASLLFDHLVV